MKLAKGSTARMGPTPAGYEDTGAPTSCIFPTVTAPSARLLVRDLIPLAVGGRTRPASRRGRDSSRRASITRNSIAPALRQAALEQHCRSTHVTSATRVPPRDVEVTYLRGGNAYTARARGVVLAVLQHD